MTYFQTPRRRHESLFSRMQNQIKKIKTRLSAAKDSYRSSRTYCKNTPTSKYQNITDRHSATTRKKQLQFIQTNIDNNISKISHPLKNVHSNNISSRSTLNIDKNLNKSDNKVGVIDRIIIRLQDQNSKLSKRLGKMQAICQDQSYRFGYIRAELRETSRELARQKQRQMKETCYLNTLLQHYKNRAKKYKKMLKENNNVSIDLATQSNA